MFLVGIGTGATAQFVSAAIADGHPHHQAKALTEGNIMAGVGVGVGPLIVGSMERLGPGWQFAPFMVVLVCLVTLLGFMNTPFPEQRSKQADAGAADTSLPLLYWMFAVLIFLAVALEWLLFYWSPDFLSTVVGYEQSTASALISVQAAAIVIGRLIGRRLLEWIPESSLLMLAFVWVLAVFPIYLFSPVPLLNVVGLFLLGLGIGNLFPLCMTGAMTAGGDQTGRASAGITLMGSSALIIMPNLVGNLADYISIRPALLSVAVLAAIAIGVTAFANRMRDD
jgi:fucose permease